MRPDGQGFGMGGGVPPDGQFPGIDGKRPEFLGFNEFPDGFDPSADGVGRPGGGKGDTNGPVSVLFYMTD